ncbi:MAG: hypothetical protein Ct9H300mP11_16450 [Chloroflexota bacterium]|nr:MAG: hypothetical protein Ct9H300mP11_16450 [Chloroflexota bacterium]
MLLTILGRKFLRTFYGETTALLNSATRFTDISLSTRSDFAMFGMGIAVGDYDRDGHKDFYLTNINKNFLLSKHPTDETFKMSRPSGR